MIDKRKYRLEPKEDGRLFIANQINPMFPFHEMSCPFQSFGCCGEWCPAFNIVPTVNGLNKVTVELHCFPQNTQFVAELPGDQSKE